MKIIIFDNNQPITEYSIKPGETLTVGRSNCHVQLPNDKVLSNLHAEVGYQNGNLFLKDHSTNGIFFNARRVERGDLIRIEEGQKFHLAGGRYGLAVMTEVAHPQPEPLEAPASGPLTQSDSPAPLSPEPSAQSAPMVTPPAGVGPKRKIVIRPGQTTNNTSNGPLPSPAQQSSPSSSGRRKIVLSPRSASISATNENNIAAILRRKGRVTIGRSLDNDIVLQSLQVSRLHCEIVGTDQSAIVTDHSKNGVFINGALIQKRATFRIGDTLTIDTHQFKLNQSGSTVIGAGQPAITAQSICKIYPGKKGKEDKVGLQTTNLSIADRDFVALMGPSGCGKSTLLKCLNGDNPPTTGEVNLLGIPLNSKNYDRLKRYIGYVPQSDIIHSDLTVDQTMYFAAKLRLADDIDDNDLKDRIDTVLSSLNINDVKIRGNLVRELSGGQRKRVSIAVELLSEPLILFLDEPTSPLDPETIAEFLNCIKELTRQGTTVIMVTHKPNDLQYTDKVLFLSYGGYVTYFGKSEDIYAYFKVPDKEIIKIYSSLTTEAEGAEWNKEWESQQSRLSRPAQPTNDRLENRSEFLPRQLYWLARRYIQIKLNDKSNLALLVAQPVIIALLLGFVFAQFRLGVLFLMSVSAIWFGVSNAAKEIVEEKEIYKRERMFNLSIGTYLLSKIIVLAIIALVQVVIFNFILYAVYSSAEEGMAVYRNLSGHIGMMFLISVSATLLGLAISATFDNTEKVMTIVPIALIPQIMLAGVVARLDSWYLELLSYLTFSRWGVEGFSRIQDDAANQADDFHVLTRVEDGEEMKDTVYHGVTEMLPDTTVFDPMANPGTPPPSPEMVDMATSAMDFLEFYGRENMLEWFNSIGLNVMAIMLLDLTIVAYLFFVLRSKDSI